MAVSRRSSQQQPQGSLQSPPRNGSLSVNPPGSPPIDIVSATVVPDGERGCSAGMENPSASPDLPAAAFSSGSSPTTTTSGGGSSVVSSPGSGDTSPVDGCPGIGGAFRELFEAVGVEMCPGSSDLWTR
ncbi:hypothetical protein DPEC_G00121430 [Dallia pectoralis]|uniref:Uncharacterized protein n=1 Tax=Dallia pectoralis TaxID=75939 RepID=A0ACC2GPZ8_DALPE|nr:hypothetical protein DPEC_G00121430 [Dallia pectoralis]